MIKDHEGYNYLAAIKNVYFCISFRCGNIKFLEKLTRVFFLEYIFFSIFRLKIHLTYKIKLLKSLPISVLLIMCAQKYNFNI